MQTAIFAAGCFWGVEAAFAELPGVIETEVGYCGGGTEHPTYEQVCAGATGHAEAVRVGFDPEKISCAALVEKFFALHDPTQVNRQGPDVGEQYRSAIFTTTLEQAQIATKIKGVLTPLVSRPIATIIEPAPTFWKAEDYHQKYFQKNAGSCHV